MYKSFGDAETEKIFNQRRSRKLPPEIQKRALVKLLFLVAATNEQDLRNPPSNHFEHLQGKLKNRCFIRINDQWRILFTLKNDGLYNVSIIDYHG